MQLKHCFNVETQNVWYRWLRSYARAAIELCPGDIEEEAVIEAYKEVVGR